MSIIGFELVPVDHPLTGSVGNLQLASICLYIPLKPLVLLNLGLDINNSVSEGVLPQQVLQQLGLGRGGHIQLVRLPVEQLQVLPPSQDSLHLLPQTVDLLSQFACL